MPRTYEIGGINVEGVNAGDEYSTIGFSGLNVGQRVEIPGPAITDATKRFWRQGIYSRVQIKVDKIIGDKAYLTIVLGQRPRLTELRFTGVSGGEKKDLLNNLAMVNGQQITPNIVARTKQLIEQYYAKKGFKNAEVSITEVPDLSQQNYVYLDVNVVKSNKIKVHKIYVEGNKVLSDGKVKRTFKKTNEKGNLLNIFKQKKFVTQDYNDDKNRLIEKYNELGYRDARIVSDSVARYDDGTVDIFLNLEEGDRYYISDISWVGNTIYDTQTLSDLLGIYPGDVYNQKLLNKRTTEDDDAVANLYLDNGYLFFQLVPIEENVKGDSVALQMRIMEGPQATINNVIINGNDRLYEKVIRRDLRVKPGALFSKATLCVQPARLPPQAISTRRTWTSGLNPMKATARWTSSSTSNQRPTTNSSSRSAGARRVSPVRWV